MDTTTIKLEDAIRIAIRHDGRTLDELAEATGLDRKTLSNWQTGKTKPSFPALVQFADVVGKPVEFFAATVSGHHSGRDDRGALVFHLRRHDDHSPQPIPGQMALLDQLAA